MTTLRKHLDRLFQTHAIPDDDEEILHEVTASLHRVRANGEATGKNGHAKSVNGHANGHVAELPIYASGDVPDGLVTLEESERITGAPIRRVDRWIRRGHIPERAGSKRPRPAAASCW